MADTQPFRPVTLYDSIALLNGGMDSEVNPLLLPKDQVAFASNATIRGGFITDRPPFTNRLNVIWPSPAVQTAFEQGLFQGAAFYNPDSGNQSIFAAVAGRLFQFQVAGNDITVTERTIPGDPNPATATQAWLWQAEQFLIWNDGLSLPVFFDGNSSRRSYGKSVLLNEVSAISQTTAPPIGGQVTLTLTAPYSGPFNVPVLFNGAFYQPIDNSAGYIIDLTNITDTPGTVYSSGTSVVIRNDVFGVARLTEPNPFGGHTSAPNTYTLDLHLTLPYTGAIGDGVILFGKVFAVVGISGSDVSIRNTQTVTVPPVANLYVFGELFIKSSVPSPNVVIGTIADTTSFTSAAAGSSSPATLTQVFTGASGTSVFIGDKQYTAAAVPSGPGGTALIVINLNDPEGTLYSTTFNQDLISVPELSAGRMGCYGLGQNWESLVDGLSYIVSDQSRGPSGTQAYNFRDAVLKTTDLTFRGGAFAIPGAGNFITSMTFTTNLDLALGQGSLMLGTPAFMASNLAPFDFTNPPATGPILTYSLIGNGPLSQNSTFTVHSDIYFRSYYGTGSLILGRRDFTSPGNLPDSAEMVRVVNLDNPALLGYGSGAFFDNREIMTVSPQATAQGVLHAGLIVKNFDTLSSNQNKGPSCWDGLWTGLNVLQLVGGVFTGKDRQFAFSYNVSLDKIELFELLKTGTDHFDNENIPILWGFETGALFNKDVKDPMQLVSLRNGEFAVDEVIGLVHFDVYYKPDQGCWYPWHSFTICSDILGQPQYFPRLGLGEPNSDECQTVNDTPARDGYTFQIKFVVRGHCRFLRLKLAAVTMPDPKMEPPACDTYIDVEV